LSESDSFIQEVSEEVRQDRMFALWKKWGPYVLAGTATELGRSGETAEAAALYRRIAGRDDVAAHYRELALLEAVRLEAATADPAAALAELAPLISDSPYALLARELAAALHLKAGDREAAHAELQAILADPGATSSLVLRAREMLTASGGELPTGAG
jgi:hypothetical protein